MYLDIKRLLIEYLIKDLWKLEHMGGLRGSVLKWMKDYLHGREMRTVIWDVGSSWENVKWTTTGFSAGTSHVSHIYKWHAGRIKELHKSVC